MAASIFSKFIEVSSKNYLKSAFHEAGYSWVKINADGLLLFLHGDAPSDFERIEAVKFGRSMVTGQRLIDNISHLESSNNKTGEVNLKILKSIGKVFFIGSFPKGFASFDFEEIIIAINLLNGGKLFSFLIFNSFKRNSSGLFISVF